VANTALDTIFISKVPEIIGTFGKLVTFMVSQAIEYDPSTGGSSVSDPVSYELKVTPPSPFNRDRVDGSRLLATDTMVILPAKDLSFDVVSGIGVIIDDIVFQVVGYNAIYSGELVVAYELQLRA
jgi:hypothetical protein